MSKNVRDIFHFELFFFFFFLNKTSNPMVMVLVMVLCDKGEQNPADPDAMPKPHSSKKKLPK
jgi:hypothetical protein